MRFKKNGSAGQSSPQYFYTVEGETCLFVQCSYGIGIRSGKSKRPPPGHRKTNARSRHATPRRARLMRWCAASCQSRAVLCRASLASLTARSRTPTVNSGRSLRCSANSNNRTAQPQQPYVTTIKSGRDEAHLLAERTEKRVYTNNVYSKILCTRKASRTHAPVHTAHTCTLCTHKHRALVHTVHP